MQVASFSHIQAEEEIDMVNRDSHKAYFPIHV